jgi:hypothetical protein
MPDPKVSTEHTVSRLRKNAKIACPEIRVSSGKRVNITSQIAQALFDKDQRLTPNTAIWRRGVLM